MHHHISSPAQKTDVRQISPRQHSARKMADMVAALTKWSFVLIDDEVICLA